MIEVVNRQRHRKINLHVWERFSAQALEAIGAQHGDVTVAFISSRRMRQLNKRFRGIDKATDVLSFPAEEPSGFPSSGGSDLGEVVLAVEQAEMQARENGLKFNEEVAQLILHGLLHLCGYDHETDKGEMNRLELRLRKQLGI